MAPTPDALSFNGTVFHTWKGNRPCRIYVASGQVYFIRRAVALDAGKATPPEQLLSKHADNYAIPVADILDARMEPKGKHVSYGPNAGRWHFTRRGDQKETVVLLETPADASRAASLLSEVLASQSDEETDPDMEHLRQVLGEEAPPTWRKLRCEVRVAPPGSAGALEIVLINGDQPDERRPTVHPPAYQAAMRVARKLSPSVRTFPGLVIEMTRLDQKRWQTGATERKRLGRQRLGAPIHTTLDALVAAVDRKPWADFQREPARYYFDKMIAWWLVRLIDGAVSDAQLQSVAPEDMKAITLLLVRDMFRHNSLLLRPRTASAEWVEELFTEVAADLEVPPGRLHDDGRPYEIEDIDRCQWASALAAPFGFIPDKLFACHSAIVTGAQKEFGSVTTRLH
jgi:hypothetical protein